MINRNNGVTEDEILQNCFTAYLLTAMRRRKRDYIQSQRRNQITNEKLSLEETKRLRITDQELVTLLTWGNLANGNMANKVFQQLSQRETYVLVSCTVGGKSYSQLAEELGIGYKGVAAIFYRAKEKLHRIMEEKQ